MKGSVELKDSTDSPAITLMLKFAKPYDFISYTNRDEAVDIENELSNEESKIQYEDMTEDQLNEIFFHVPEQSMDFRQYIDYMNRDYATKSKVKDGITAAFDKTDDHLTTDTVELYKDQLKTAYNNQSLLWQVVISFDNEFLASQGLFDKDSKKVDQKTIKSVIRDNMPKLLKAEGIENTAFWWGNIHLNTDNIHVHLGISEVQSARDIIYNESSHQEERKGTFSQKSMKSFKSNVYNGLLDDLTKAKILRKEQVIANLKTDLISHIKFENQATKNESQFYLEEAYTHLPTDTRWRFGSNAKNFAVSKFYLNKFIDHYLETEGKEYFDNFQKETKNFLDEYETAYTSKNGGEIYEKLRYVNNNPHKQLSRKKGYNKDDLFQKRVVELRERIGNQVLKYMKETPPIVSNSDDSMPHFPKIRYLSVDDLGQLIESMKNEPTNDAKSVQELGMYRAALRKKNLEIRKYVVENQMKILSSITPVPSDKPYVNLKIQESREYLQLVQLQLKPSRKLTAVEKQLKKDLEEKYTDPVTLPITQATDICVHQSVKQFKTEIETMQSVKDGSLVPLITGMDKQQYTQLVENKIQVMIIKNGIYNRNKLISSTQNVDEKKKYKQQNSAAFSNLKELYQVLSTDNKKPIEDSYQPGQLKWTMKPSRGTASVTRGNTHSQATSNAAINHSNQTIRASKSFLSGLSQAIKSGNKENMDAFMRKVYDDEREEQEQRNRER